MSRQKYDEAKAALDNARAQLASEKAKLQVARDQGAYSTLLADADGTVVKTLAEPGQVVTAGQTVVRLAHAGSREATVNLPETVRPAIGSAARASLYGSDTRWSARLRQLSDAADPLTRTYEARYILEGDAAAAPLGATVTIHLASSQPPTATMVPLGAIDDEGKDPGVWILDRASSSVSFRPVQVLQLGTESAVLGRGVEPGERVVALGAHLLHEGEQVRVAEDEAELP